MTRAWRPVLAKIAAAIAPIRGLGWTLRWSRCWAGRGSEVVARVDLRNVSRYWWDRHVPGLSLMHADFTTHEYPPHSHEAFVVAVTEVGGSIIKSRGVIEEAHDLFHDRELLIGTSGRLFRRHGSVGSRIEPPVRDRAVVDRAIAEMRARYAEAVRLEALADLVGLTTFQLIGAFRRAVGLTPHAYLTQIRLSMACRHLRRGVPIAEAAAVSGFYDQSALTRHFKRRYGITPSQFARAAKERAGSPSIFANTAASLSA